MSADGPEEREFERAESFERDLDQLDLDEMLADEECGVLERIECAHRQDLIDAGRGHLVRP